MTSVQIGVAHDTVRSMLGLGGDVAVTGEPIRCCRSRHRRDWAVTVCALDQRCGDANGHLTVSIGANAGSTSEYIRRTERGLDGEVTCQSKPDSGEFLPPAKNERLRHSYCSTGESCVWPDCREGVDSPLWRRWLSSSSSESYPP